VAAALGNGVVGQHFLSPEAFQRALARGFVNYQAAGRLARELFAAMPRFLDGAATISSDEFLRAAYAATRASLPGAQPAPIDYVHSQVSVAEPAFADAAQRLRDAAWSGFPYLRDYPGLDDAARVFLAMRPCMSATLMLSAAPAAADLAMVGPTVGPAREHATAIATAAARSRGVVYALPRTAGSYAFLFIAVDLATMTELVDRFVALASAGAGVLVELPR
jgi:hypothetical protein